MYKLTKEHVRCYNKAVPILMDSDLCCGPYDRGSTLPHANNSTANAFVMRHLLNELLPGDPSLTVDEGADKAAYCWQYLTDRTPRGTYDFAEFYHKLKTKGIDVPELA